MHAGRAAILERWILRCRYNRTPVSPVRLERFLPETPVRGDEHRRAWNHHSFSRVRFLKITGWLKYLLILLFVYAPFFFFHQYLLFCYVVCFSLLDSLHQ